MILKTELVTREDCEDGQAMTVYIYCGERRYSFSCEEGVFGTKFKLTEGEEAIVLAENEPHA